jgi:hypothetical protein
MGHGKWAMGWVMGMQRGDAADRENLSRTLSQWKADRGLRTAAEASAEVVSAALAFAPTAASTSFRL